MEDFADLTESHLRLEAMLDELGDDGILLGELDGFLCGVICGPEPIGQDEWLPLVFDAGIILPADSQAELTALVLARHDEIVSELAEDNYQPLYEVDPTNDDVLWEIWVSGLERAMGLRLDSWEKLIKRRRQSQAQDAVFAIVSLIAASDPNLDAADHQDPELVVLRRDAPAIIPEIVTTLYRAHRLAVSQSPIRAVAVGRNDPCPCGSGLKYKRCHGKA